MAIRQVALSDIPRRKKTPSNLLRELEQFIDSGWEACEVETRQYKNPQICRTTYYKAIQRYGFRIRVMMVDDRVFLIREVEA